MFVACWSVKGGSGTTVVSAALALSLAARGHDTLLVDLAGDVPAALGVPDPQGPGLADWLGAGADALARLEADAAANLSMLPTGGVVPDAPKRAEDLAAVLAVDSRAVVADCGSVATPTAIALAGAAPLSLLVLRPCYLALRRALQTPLQPAGVVLVGEPQRALQQADVEDVLGVRVRAAVPWKSAVATAVDAGLLARRLPSVFDRAFHDLVETVAA